MTKGKNVRQLDYSVCEVKFNDIIMNIFYLRNINANILKLNSPNIFQNCFESKNLQ